MHPLLIQEMYLPVLVVTNEVKHFKSHRSTGYSTARLCGFSEPEKPRKDPFSGATVDGVPIWGLSGGPDNPPRYC